MSDTLITSDGLRIICKSHKASLSIPYDWVGFSISSLGQTVTLTVTPDEALKLACLITKELDDATPN
jgi:hypothetical protein